MQLIVHHIYVIMCGQCWWLHWEDNMCVNIQEYQQCCYLIFCFYNKSINKTSEMTYVDNGIWEETTEWSTYENAPEMSFIHGKNQSNNTLCSNQNMIYSGGIWKCVTRAKCNKNRTIMWKNNTHQTSKLLFFLFISVINQLDAQKFCFTIRLFHASCLNLCMGWPPIDVMIPEAV